MGNTSGSAVQLKTDSPLPELVQHKIPVIRHQGFVGTI